MSGFWGQRGQRASVGGVLPGVASEPGIIYFLYELGTGRRITRKWRELERTQWLSLPELQALQGQRLCALARHAYDTVSYYRRAFDVAGVAPGDICQVERLVQLPLLTKEAIQTRPEELISHAFLPKDRLPNHTGGSTGTPLRFFQDRRQRDWASANKWRCNRWAGWDFGKRVLRLWGHPRDLSAMRTAVGKLRNLALRERTLDAFRFSDRDLDEVIRTIRRWRPQVIVGYGSMLAHLAAYVEGRRIPDLPPTDGIISSADMLLPYQRDRVESVLHAPVFDRYGCREVDTIAAECDRHEGLHINVDRLVVECVDEAGRHVAPGRTGRVVVTDLFNYAMPFIRYDVGDLATVSTVMCGCGRGLPLLGQLVGRFTDVLTTPEGDYVSVSALTTILSQVPGLGESQFVQKAADWLVVKIVRRADELYSAEADARRSYKYTAQSESIFRQHLAEIFGPRVRITFEYVDEIPKTSSGKARLSVSETTSQGA